MWECVSVCERERGNAYTMYMYGLVNDRERNRQATCQTPTVSSSTVKTSGDYELLFHALVFGYCPSTTSKNIFIYTQHLFTSLIKNYNYTIDSY